MFVLAGMIAAWISGTLPTFVSAMTAWQWASLAQAGITLPHKVNQIEHFFREMDRRFPCGRKCHAEIKYRMIHEMNGGPLGWGRSPFKYMP